MNLLSLPYTLFLDVLTYLSPLDTLRCRRVSRSLHTALTRQELCVSLLLVYFPRAVEMRTLRELIALDNLSSDDGFENVGIEKDCVNEGLVRDAKGIGHGLRADDVDWSIVFTRLTRRYFHLSTATLRRIYKLPTLKSSSLQPVNPWDIFLRLDSRMGPFHHPDPMWTFDEGVLVYPSPTGLVARYLPFGDLGEEVPVPFDMEGKVVRRLRLKGRVLIVEWAEEEACQALNERDMVHRHFATAFDIQGPRHDLPLLSQSTPSAPSTRETTVPSTKRSTSSSTWSINFRSEWKIHYVGMPLSSHDRFFSAHDDNFCAVYIWQPTRSPWGEAQPLERLIVWDISQTCDYRPSLDPAGRGTPDTAPKVVRRLVNEELTHWNIRQGETPTLRELRIDGGHVIFHNENHRWCAGPQAADTLPRVHHVKSTAIPIMGLGPAWEDSCGGGGEDEALNLCGRRTRKDGVWGGAGGGMWPGWAPCWRHDDFPYLTVDEMWDARAGVRVSARHCFMLETLSVHVRPKLRVRWEAGEEAWSDENEEGEGSGDVGAETQFADGIWREIMGAGCIQGNERGVVGQDEVGDVTVLEF